MTALSLLILAGFAGMLLPFVFVIIPELFKNRGHKRVKSISPQQQVKELEDEVSLLKSVTSVKSDLWGERVPEVVAKVDRLYRAIMNLRPRLSTLGPSTYHTVISTGTKYLPDAVGAYLKLPREVRDTVLVDGQKTAKDLLCEQLDIMNAELKEILDETQKVDATELVVHGRFLEEKYGKAEPVIEDVPKITAEAVLESRIRTSFSVPNVVIGSDGIRYHGSDDFETTLMRALDGSVSAQYTVPTATWHREGDLPTVPKPFEPIPAGTYPVEVVDAETWESKGGNPGFQLKLVVTSGQFAGRKLWKTLVVPRNEQGMRMFERQVAALGARCDLESVRWVGNAGALSLFLGRRARAWVRIDEYQGRQKNVVEFLTSPDSRGMVTT